MTNSLQRFDPFRYISSFGYITILIMALWSYAFAFSWFLPLTLGECSVAFCALCAVPTSIIVFFLASLSIVAFRKRSRSELRSIARLPLSKKLFAATSCTSCSRPFSLLF
jgi:amino acid transporter